MLGGLCGWNKGDGTIEEAVESVAWYNAADPLAVKQWELLGAALERAYTEIIEDAGAGEMKANGWALKFEVQKAKKKIPVVPVNPFSIRWIRMKSAAQVAEISNQQKTLLRTILADGFEKGVRPNAILEEIGETVGLTVRERGWVASRKALLVEEGFTGGRLTKAVGRYSQMTLSKRAQRIARTETIDAYSQGISDSWALAKEEGLIDENVMQKWVELTESDRTCEICKGLGESEPVPVGEPFISEFIGEVERPPSHPHCRCTRILIQVDAADAAESIDSANSDAIATRSKLAGG